MAISRHVAFLRALNVGGRIIKMAELAALFEGLELDGVDTFLASGNVLFNADDGQTEQLHEIIEGRFQSTFGFISQSFIRNENQLAQIAKLSPFTEAMMAEARTNCVGFTRQPLPASALKALRVLGSEADNFHIEAEGREIYWLSYNPQSDASFTLKQLEKALGLSATFRGMNTIVRLLERCRRPGKSQRSILDTAGAG